MIYAVLLIWSCDHFFFWDTVQLASKHAHFFYECNLSCILLPEAFDSGHIPLLGYSLAVVWKIFGKNLIVSHLMMWPFVFGIVYQYLKLANHYLPTKYALSGALIFLLDPTLLTQITLISPDVILIFCVIYWLRKMENFQLNIWNILVATLLCLISLRGALVAFSFGIYLMLTYIKNPETRKLFIPVCLTFLPGTILFCAYMCYHFVIKGWIGYHLESPWAPSFQRVDMFAMAKNLMIIVWRLFDFGRCIWLFLLISLFFNIKKLNVDQRHKNLLTFGGIVFFILVVNSIPYNGLLAHRYFMPFVAFFSLFILSIFFHASISHQTKIRVSWIVIASLLLGNFIRYPWGISQGWDASMAHAPYFKLRKEMYQYMNDENIDIGHVASSFPNISKEKFISLNKDERAMQDINFCPQCKYIMYSNVFNEMHRTKKSIKNQYKLKKRVSALGVFIDLYQLNK